MKKTSLLILLIVVFTGCLRNNSDRKNNQEILYPQNENKKIVIEYYSNKQIKRVTILNKDSSQSAIVGFDSLGIVSFTGINIKSNRTHAIEYYRNGRPKGLVNFDSLGTGDAIYYYDNGNKKSEGRFQALSQVGIWKGYSQNGELVKIDTMKSAK